MKSQIIHDTRRFVCRSYGNGTAYALEKRAPNPESILFQGDDANQFRTELDTLANGRISLSYDEMLGVLWNDYESCARRELIEKVKNTPSVVRPDIWNVRRS